MQILRLLAARRAASLGSRRRDAGENDEGPFFDFDFTSSFRVSFSSSVSDDSDSDESCAELDYIISLQRSSSASPLKFRASEPPTRANSLPSQRHGDRKRGITLRSLSFGARKAAPLYRRPSFARSSSGRHSFARSSTSSVQSLRLFMGSPPHAEEEDELEHATRQSKRAPSRDVIRRCLAKISRRIRTVASPQAAEARGHGRLRKCRSASSAVLASRRDDDSAVEKQDGIASAIAHCKESFHRGACMDFCHAVSVAECDLPLVRSRSDTGKFEAAP
ncbi:unnamed protein product [Alopecurus aequalis]